MHVEEGITRIGGREYRRVLIRDSYRDGNKVKHRTIANISKCSPAEIQAIKLALKYKENLADYLIDRKDIDTEQGLSVGSVHSLLKVAQVLGIVKALGNTEESKRALWMILARIIEPGSRMANVRLAQTHAAVDILGMDKFNEDDLYDAMDWLESHKRIIEKKLFNSRYGEKKPVLYLYV